MATVNYTTREDYGYDEFVFTGETRQVYRGEYYLYENKICKAFKYDITRGKYPILKPVIKFINTRQEARDWCKANKDRIIDSDESLYYTQNVACHGWKRYKILTYMGENGLAVWKPLTEFEVVK